MWTLAKRTARLRLGKVCCGCVQFWAEQPTQRRVNPHRKLSVAVQDTEATSSNSGPTSVGQLGGAGGASSVNVLKTRPELLWEFSIPRIRNFSIIAHIDHGKSTLADALLVRTGNITQKSLRGNQQMLDTLKVERERGITVKAQTASMVYRDSYLLNLIDTPGHVDFSYEVVRSLSACQGALLLVDACQGVQAQTLTTFQAAREAGLLIVPVVTKIDLPNAQPEDTILSMATSFDLEPEDVLLTSAKTGEGVAEVLEAIVARVPPPPYQDEQAAPLRARLVDSWFDGVRGVVCLVQVVDGVLREGDRITTCHLMSQAAQMGSGVGEAFGVQEIGVLSPTPIRTRELRPGQVGYAIAGMRSTRQALVGDTIIQHRSVQASSKAAISAGSAPVPEALPLFKPAKSMLFASVFPMDDGDFDSLLKAVERLALNDAALHYEKESSSAMGFGLRVGFLGLLHMEVFHQRLVDEFNAHVLITTPTVPFKLVFSDGTERTVVDLSEWPGGSNAQMSQALKFKVYEPMVEATILTPMDCLGNMIALVKDRRGQEVDTKYLGQERAILVYKLPWQEVVTDFHDQAKNVSSGYASFNYKEIPSEEADLVKVDITLNGEVSEALSFVCHRDKAQAQGRLVCKKLVESIDRQQFEIVVQARLYNKSIARERVAPFRKDVLVKSGKLVGGGDVTRKKKLLEKQKAGKKRSKTVGKVVLTQDAFWSVLSKT